MDSTEAEKGRLIARLLTTPDLTPGERQAVGEIPEAEINAIIEESGARSRAVLEGKIDLDSFVEWCERVRALASGKSHETDELESSN